MWSFAVVGSAGREVSKVRCRYTELVPEIRWSVTRETHGTRLTHDRMVQSLARCGRYGQMYVGQ
jgi:hypothetical protein